MTERMKELAELSALYRAQHLVGIPSYHFSFQYIKTIYVQLNHVVHLLRLPWTTSAICLATILPACSLG